MRRHGKRDKPENKGKEEKKVNGEPLTDKMEKISVRQLLEKGAFTSRVTDEQFGVIMREGEIEGELQIKREGKKPVITGKVKAEGIEGVTIELEVCGILLGKDASEVLKEAGAPEELVRKIRYIESAMREGDYRLVDELVGLGDLDPGPALGGIENAFIKKKDK